MSVEQGPLGIQIDHDQRRITVSKDSLAGFVFESFGQNYPYAPMNEIFKVVDPDIAEGYPNYSWIIEHPAVFGLWDMFSKAQEVIDAMGLEAYEEFQKRAQNFEQEYPKWRDEYWSGKDSPVGPTGP